MASDLLDCESLFVARDFERALHSSRSHLSGLGPAPVRSLPTPDGRDTEGMRDQLTGRERAVCVLVQCLQETGRGEEAFECVAAHYRACPDPSAPPEDASQRKSLPSCVPPVVLKLLFRLRLTLDNEAGKAKEILDPYVRRATYLSEERASKRAPQGLAGLAGLLGLQGEVDEELIRLYVLRCLGDKAAAEKCLEGLSGVLAESSRQDILKGVGVGKEQQGGDGQQQAAAGGAGVAAASASGDERSRQNGPPVNTATKVPSEQATHASGGTTSAAATRDVDFGGSKGGNKAQEPSGGASVGSQGPQSGGGSGAGGVGGASRSVPERSLQSSLWSRYVSMHSWLSRALSLAVAHAMKHPGAALAVLFSTLVGSLLVLWKSLPPTVRSRMFGQLGATALGSSNLRLWAPLIAVFSFFFVFSIAV